MLYVLTLVPLPVRDWFYDYFARHRYGWFGRTEECQIPAASLRSKFLD
jgi:predicted DCC family thiol-disulfide oxidoreductase YuxK